MSESGYEFVLVESPLIGQLEGMGWRHQRGGPVGHAEPSDPKASFRASFADSVLDGILHKQLRKLNLDSAGNEWLDEGRIAQAVSELTRLGATSLLEANSAATRLLLDGTVVDGVEGWDGGRDQRVKFIDFVHPERNDFLAISQFRLYVPGTSRKKSVIPDVVLFVNGIPLVVIECKKPTFHGGSTAQAIEQLRRYANQRGATIPEGNEKLFHTTQLTVATCGNQALLGTFTAGPGHFAVWRDPYPLTKPDLASTLGKSEAAVSEQDVLAAGVLHPHRLLDIVRNFVVFMEVEADDGSSRRVKIAPRYQQYRAVCKSVDRLLTGKTLTEDGDSDRRGGIIWHTQGSGKSLTMVFLVRKMRSTPGLGHFKVVLITDRTQLQKQLSDTAKLADEKPDVVKRAKGVPGVLARKGPGMVFVMIQKQVDASKAKGSADTLAHDRSPGWDLLNEDESILILVDEAHRSQGSALHKNLMDSLPNAARIGFTGTPIIMREKNRTTNIFGQFIDMYRLKEAEEDGAIVPIVYEGRIAKGAITEAEDLEDAIAQYFPELTDEEYDLLQERYATASDVLAADSLVRKKARDMLAHYVSGVMPNGFKAQVVAHTRRIAVRYRDALLAARAELVAEAEKLSDVVLAKELEQLKGRRAVQVAARRQIDLLKAIDFVPVISEGQNDTEDIAAWTDGTGQEAAIDQFRKSFPSHLSEGDKPVAFLIVRTMLLTGFDAPIEQAMYLDRRIKEAELLQAIARVNRVADRKRRGFVVDYAGVSKHLQAAMEAYSAEDAEGKPIDFAVEIAKLEPRRNRLKMLFTDRGVTPADDPISIEACIELLADEDLRDKFEVALRKFLMSVETVMPRKEAKPFLADVRLFALIAKWTRARYRETGEFDPSQYGEKVRELIDRHVIALGVSQVIPPAEITAQDFSSKVEGLPGAKAQASEMQHAIRHHIDLYFNQDPAAYAKLRERLEKILEEYTEQWEQQVLLFQTLVDEAIQIHEHGADASDATLGKLSKLEQALYGAIVEEVLTDGIVPLVTRDHFVTVAAGIEDLAFDRTRKKNFWNNQVARSDFQKAIVGVLVTAEVGESQHAGHLADKLFEIVSHRRHELQRSHRPPS
ncbi:type I restriction endonuclease subunit R [Streptomyces sp. NPDC088801]|uniref:type I restriction endonuclease subunit R n=1 Tax=Streptomyces sp. NPDC088801 TaxID=3365903 RepID=UPI003817270D